MQNYAEEESKDESMNIDQYLGSGSTLDLDIDNDCLFLSYNPLNENYWAI